MFKHFPKNFFDNLKSLFYAFSITAGIYVALTELHENNNMNGFILFSTALFVIYMAEIFIHWINKSSKVEINLNIHDEVNELSHLFHKIILPIALYIALVGFGFYNIKAASLKFLMIGVFIIFFILFINIRAFFENKLTLEHKTHYIYDIIKFFIFFCAINVFSNSANNYPSFLLAYSLASGVLCFVIIVLMLWRYKHFQQNSTILSVIPSILIGVIFYFYQMGRVVNSLQVGLGVFFVFYLSTALIHHKVTNTLSRDVLIEYLLVILLVLAITYGIS